MHRAAARGRNCRRTSRSGWCRCPWAGRRRAIAQQVLLDVRSTSEPTAAPKRRSAGAHGIEERKARLRVLARAAGPRWPAAARASGRSSAWKHTTSAPRRRQLGLGQQRHQVDLADLVAPAFVQHVARRSGTGRSGSARSGRAATPAAAGAPRRPRRKWGGGPLARRGAATQDQACEPQSGEGQQFGGIHQTGAKCQINRLRLPEPLDYQAAPDRHAVRFRRDGRLPWALRVPARRTPTDPTRPCAGPGRRHAPRRGLSPWRRRTGRTSLARRALRDAAPASQRCPHDPPLLVLARPAAPVPLGAHGARPHGVHAADGRRAAEGVHLEGHGGRVAPHGRLPAAARLRAGLAHRDPVEELRLVADERLRHLDGRLRLGAAVSDAGRRHDHADPAAQRGAAAVPGQARRLGGDAPGRAGRPAVHQLSRCRPRTCRRAWTCAGTRSSRRTAPLRRQPGARGRRAGDHHVHLGHHRHAQGRDAQLRRTSRGRSTRACGASRSTPTPACSATCRWRTSPSARSSSTGCSRPACTCSSPRACRPSRATCSARVRPPSSRCRGCGSSSSRASTRRMPPQRLERLLKIPVAGRFLRRKILKALGLDACRYAAGGAAPMPPDLLRWYSIAGPGHHRGLRHDRELRRLARDAGRHAPPRHRGRALRRREVAPRSGDRRDPGQDRLPDAGLLQGARAQRRGLHRRRLAAHRRQGRRRGGRLPAHHRPREGSVQDEQGQVRRARADRGQAGRQPRRRGLLRGRRQLPAAVRDADAQRGRGREVARRRPAAPRWKTRWPTTC